MPELPEVETIRRALAPRVTGRRIVDAGAFPSGKFTPAIDAKGTTIESVGRRGKYLIVALDDDRDLVIHLGMTGVLRVVDARTDDDKFLRAWWALDDGGSPALPGERETFVLEYSDIRRFGRIAVYPSGDYAASPTLRVLGPEPFSEDFSPAALHTALNGSKRAVKTQLLSQRPVAGVGNIYADEALWIARVHPVARHVTRPQAARLRDAIREVLASAIERRGTTLRDYRTFDGDYGENQHFLRCYGRAGEPCERCGTELRRIVLDARGTTYCPKCQRR